MLNTYIFDFNGTMIFDAELQQQSWSAILKQSFNHVMTNAEFQTAVAGRNNQYTFDYFADTPLTTAEVTDLSAAKEQLYRDICLKRPDKFQLVAGLAGFLTTKQADGAKLNIATASEAENVDFFFDHLQLGQWFDRKQVVINDGQLPGKPAPDMFLTAMTRVHGDRAHTAIFEDSPSGLLAANHAQVSQTVLVHDPNTTPITIPVDVTVDQRITTYQTLPADF
ncbi:beta-phosphoglucomutase [Lactiplantibacillus fabifermentans T30PCM01]|uniref:Beta-phosphoglucomutase n=1 Tax=Lactiplantibacillus fabifermentans T30PCM01 TaxID=1400520 RepID=W6TBK8_9LACO|nr:HAD family phosphatase [Lactiplantibacillus fabifermentans]ETY72815.1 beta-phosphoglucomutase [Lactiplantibacillus fabifermentans T30PCM01]